nr:uncharacterized mitochondrial protein AtMg00810-like [Tanacetum cinerariifolium]
MPPITQVVEGVETTIALTTAEERHKEDAKSLLQVVEKRFGGNAAAKKTQRNLLKQQCENFTASSSEVLDQTFDRLQKLISQLEIPGEKEMDLRWQMDMITMRERRFLKNTRRKFSLNGNETIGFDKSKVECYNCHKRGHFARECRAPGSQDTKHKESTRMTVPVETSASAAFVSCDGLGGYDWSLGYNVVSSPYTRNILPPKPDLSFSGLEEFMNEPIVSEPTVQKPVVGTNEAKASADKTKDVRKNFGSPLIKDWILDSKDEAESKPKIEKKTVKPSFAKIVFVNLKRKKHVLLDYKEIDEGYVAFGGNPKGEKITGKDKRRNKTLIEAARTMLADSKLPTTFWAEAVILLAMCKIKCKFNGKSDEGFFVGYSLSSKTFRVFNSTTRIVEENLHIRFSKNTSNVVGSRPDWLFDIDALTRIINYKPIAAGTQSIGFADPKCSQDDGFQPTSNGGKKVDEDSSNESECKDQEQKVNVNRTNNVYTAGTNGVNTVGVNTNNELPFDHEMPALEDISTFNFSNDHKDVDEEADINNMDTTIQVSPAPTIRNHKDHPLDQVIRDLYSTTQTRNMLKNLEEHGFVTIIHQRTNHKDFQNCLFACFLSQEEPKKKEVCNAFEKMTHEKSRMSSMGELTFFLGLQVKQNQDGIFISQDKYVAEILRKYGFTKVKNASTPMKTKKPLLKDKDGEEVDVHMYRSMIGLLMYLTSSRPDIMFAVCACARYQVNQKVSHLHAVKRIFRYLKGQSKFGLWYPKDSLFDLVAYTDSDYAGASLDRKFTIGDFRCRLISWQCKKQTMVLNSTTEAKYKKQKPRKTKRKDTELPQTSGPTTNAADEDVNKEMNDSLVRAVTTASSLEAEHDNGNINKTQSKATSNESSFQGTDLGGGPRCQETIRATIAQTRVKKLEKKKQLRTHKLKRIYKVGLTARVESFDDDEDLGEDAYKQGRISDTDVDEGITLVSTHNDAKMFDANQDLSELKHTKPKAKAKGIVFHEPEESTTTTTVAITKPESQDKGKAKMIEKPMKLKKDQIQLDEEVALKLEAELQAEFDNKVFLVAVCVLEKFLGCVLPRTQGCVLEKLCQIQNLVAFCLKTVAFCLKTVAFCLKSVAFCLNNVAFCLKTVAFCLKTVAFCLKTVVFCLKSVAFCLKREPDLPVLVPESFHEQTDEELTETDIKQIDADDQAIQTILLGLLEDVYAAVDSCKTAKEIWERVHQMMKGLDIGEQEKKAKLFNEWEKFTSTDGESIESYYHLRQTKNLHETDFTQIYDFLKMNQEEVNELRAERLAKSHDPLALMAHSQNSFNFPTTHKDQSSSSTHPQQSFLINNKYNPQPSLNQNFMQPPMTSLKHINDPTEAMNTALILFGKAFQLFAPTNNNQRTSSNPRSRQLAQPNQQVFNAWQNSGIQDAQNAGLRVQELGIKPGATTVEDWVISLGIALPGQGEGEEMLLIFKPSCSLLKRKKQGSNFKLKNLTSWLLQRSG